MDEVIHPTSNQQENTLWALADKGSVYLDAYTVH